MTFIHTALTCEAKPIVEYFKLQCMQTKPYKIYKKNNIILIVSGIGKEKTALYVKDIFKKFNIKKAINVGIVGCKNKKIKIGSLFCTNRRLENIQHATLTSVDKALENNENLKTTLVDMEAKMFLHVSSKFLSQKDIYVLKVVSDHLDTTIPKKEFVWNIIEKNLKDMSKIVTSQN
ncbi:MAG: nucleoside phosphorylase [Sulfurospirillum sp.]|nr:nucleoside phosphorylase [Sulfurospirillum sp.]MBL0702421.1 nucleoside phosphorylase [Sulfurospirillum sp.]